MHAKKNTMPALICTISRPGARSTVQIAMPSANAAQYAKGFVDLVKRRYGIAAVRQLAMQYPALVRAAAANS